MTAPHTQQFQQALNSVTTVDLASGSTKLLGEYPISPDDELTDDQDRHPASLESDQLKGIEILQDDAQPNRSGLSHRPHGHQTTGIQLHRPDAVTGANE